MGIDRLLCLTLNTNDSLKQFLGKILLNLMDFLKIYPLSYYLNFKNINIAILSAFTFYCINRYVVAKLRLDDVRST